MKGKIKKKSQVQLDKEGIFPDYEPILQDFESMICWKIGENRRKVPEPVPGMAPEFDSANKKVD